MDQSLCGFHCERSSDGSQLPQLEEATSRYIVDMQWGEQMQGRIQIVLLGGGANYGKRGSASLYGGLGACPQWGPGAEAWLGGQEADAFL